MMGNYDDNVELWMAVGCVLRWYTVLISFLVLIMFSMLTI